MRHPFNGFRISLLDPSTFARLVAGAVLPSALLAAAPGCSSSSSPSNNPSPSNDASTDAPVATTDDAGETTGNDSGTPTSSPDGGIAAQMVTETKLVADTDAGGAPTVDPSLVNPWGIAFNPSGPAWLADNGTGLLSVWDGKVLGLQVTVPPPGDAGGTAAPSGQIFNTSLAATAGAFDGDLFIVCTEDGTVSGWQPIDGGFPTNATLRVDNSGAGSVYKGLAILPTTPPVLAVADFHNNNISVFSTSYAPVTPATGAWKDPSLPAGYAPFNIVVIGTNVYVLYAFQDSEMMDGELGPGQGALSVFSTTGTLVKSLVAANGPLSSPWGLVQAPAGWGSVGGQLLVANFGNGGGINAFDPTSGAQTAYFATSSGSPLHIDGLWGLAFSPVANADAGITTSQLYFTAGPNQENDGLFGYLTVP
jgi:uncharacterized protein (TIGR03118 family)